MAQQGPQKKWGAKEWAILIAGMIIVPSVAGWLGRSAGEVASKREVEAGPAAEPEFKAVASTQPAAGLTDELMDQEFLSKLEDYTVERLIVNTRRALDDRGVNSEVHRPTSSAVYVMSGAHKIAVIRTKVATEGATVQSAFLLAVFGNEVRRVTCISTNREVAISFGPCADKIEETYGFRI